MTFFAMSLLFVRTTITADRDGLTITRSAIGISSTKQLKVREVDSVSSQQTIVSDSDGLTIMPSAIGISSVKQSKVCAVDSVTAEQTMSSGNTVYYSLKVKTSTGSISVGSGILGREIANRLAVAVNAAMQIG